MMSKKLNDVFPDGFTGGGIFHEMVNPVWGSDYQADDLDLQFFSEYGDKPIAPLLEHLLDNTGVIPTLNIKRLASMLQSRFGKQWQHKYAILSLQYDPIENYSMTEGGTDTKTGTEKLIGNKDNTGTETLAKSGKETVTRNGEDKLVTDVENDVYGFNSSNPVPSDEGEQTATRTYTDLEDSTEFENREDETTYNLAEDVDNTTTYNLSEGHSLTRSGNIGVTTSQQMIESEIELWKWNFIDDVFKDIIKIISLPLYEIKL